MATGGTSSGGTGGEGGRRSASFVELKRVGGRGFCIEEGMLIVGRVEGDATGALTFSGLRHLGWDEAPGCPSSQCELAQTVGPTALADADRADFEQLLARLPLVPCEGRVDPVCDPCLETNVAVDGARHFLRACMSGCDESAMAVWQIGEFLDTLAALSVTP